VRVILDTKLVAPEDRAGLKATISNELGEKIPHGRHLGLRNSLAKLKICNYPARRYRAYAYLWFKLT
jgi:hypothetical protein